MSMESEAEYDLSPVLDVAAAANIEAGSSLLVTGPALAGKDEFLHSVLARGISEGQGAVVVTTDDDANRLVADIQSRTPESEGHEVAAIDCRGDGDREQTELAQGGPLTRVGTPADLTGIGIGITQSFERLQEAGLTKGRVGLTSLSTLLTFTDEKTVFKFAHVLTSRIDAAGYLGVFTIDASAHDEQTLQIVTQAFDGVVDVRDDGSREARVRGLGEASEWAAF